MWDLEANFSW